MNSAKKVSLVNLHMCGMCKINRVWKISTGSLEVVLFHDIRKSHVCGSGRSHYAELSMPFTGSIVDTKCDIIVVSRPVSPKVLETHQR